METVTVTPSPHDGILTPEAIDFVVALDREFGARRVQLLDRRRRRRAARTTELDFLPSTLAIRADESWQVAPPVPHWNPWTRSVTISRCARSRRRSAM